MAPGNGLATVAMRHRLPVQAGLVLVYALALHLLYVLEISPVYAYAGFTYEPAFSALELIVSTVIALVPSLYLPRNLRAPSSIILWILYLVLVVPAHLIAAVVAGISFEQRLGIIALSHIMLGTLVVGRRIIPQTRPSTNDRQIDPEDFWGWFLGVAVVANLLVLYATGVRNPLTTAEDIYGTRLASRSAVRGVVGYLYPWVVNVINPVLMIRAFLRQRWFLAAAMIVIQVLLFSATGGKAILFSLLLALILAYGAGRRFEPQHILVPFAGLAFAALAMAQVGNHFLSVNIVRRIMLIPALFTHIYVDYFEPDKRLRFGYVHGVSLLPGSTPTEAPARIIGLEVFRNPNTNANGNSVAEGYANLGPLGVIILSLVILAFLIALDWVVLRRPGRGRYQIVAGLMSFIGLVLTNTSVLTALLTHGLLITLCVLYLMPADRDAPGPPRRPPMSRAREPVAR